MWIGVIKTYKLTYESVEVMHALFNKDAAKNKWSIGASVLRSFTEYFGPTTEQLDVCAENGHVTFTSYTEKIMDGRGRTIGDVFRFCLDVRILMLPRDAQAAIADRDRYRYFRL